MKSIILIAAFAIVSVAAGYGQQGQYNTVMSTPSAYGSIDQTGQSSVWREQDSYGNTQFGYEESHATGGSSRREEIANGVTRGSYSLSDADGRRRTVHYIADKDGFRAVVDTNEPGVEPKNPANVIINSAARRELSLARPAPVSMPVPLPVAPIASYSRNNLQPIAVPAPVFQRAEPMNYASVAALAPAPVQVYAQERPTTSYGQTATNFAQEAPTPLAFSYNFATQHQSSRPIFAAAPRSLFQAPIEAPRLYQQQQQQLSTAY